MYWKRAVSPEPKDVEEWPGPTTMTFRNRLTEELLDESCSSLTLDDDDHACAQPLAPWRASGS